MIVYKFEQIKKISFVYNNKLLLKSTVRSGQPEAMIKAQSDKPYHHSSYSQDIETQQPVYTDYESLKKYQTTSSQIPSSVITQDHSLQQIYRTNINELISQPIQDNPYSMENVYSSLYQLSAYLWNKKFSSNNALENVQNQSSTLDVSFDDYLLPIQEELTKYDKFRKNKVKEELLLYNLIHSDQKDFQKQSKSNQKPNQKSNQNHQITPLNKNQTNTHLQSVHSLESQLIKCYQQVPFIYFEQNFSLNFSNFYDKENRQKYNNTQTMKEEQEKMNDNLDLIEINLFGQIHRKFEDYFKAAANFDYLQESIHLQLIKLSQCRKRMSKVQNQFVKKSQRLRKKIIQRNNYQKLIKKLKIIKTLKKLPQVIKTILQSSLPYECLELLKTTKKSISQVAQINCVQKILSNIKSSQTIVQLGLNKKYTDQLYLYIEQAFGSINFIQQFKKLTMDCPIVDDKQQNSTLNNMSRRSETGMQESSFRANDRSGFFVLDELGQSKGNDFGGKPMLKNTYAKRQEAKEYEIAMILLQSYEYVDFPVDVTKIKISNGLRVICRKFEKDLITHIKKQLQKMTSTHSSSFVLNGLNTTQQSVSSLGMMQSKSQQKTIQIQEDTPQKVRECIDKVSVQFYIRNIRVLNDLFKQSINRYLGYVLTLVTEYQEKLFKDITEIDKTANNKINSTKSIEKSTKSIENSTKSIENSSRSIEFGSQKEIIKVQTDPNVDQLSLSKVRSLQKSEKMSKMQTTHTKFKQIFAQELSVLPSIFKIIQQKIKHFMTQKNLGNASPQQFFQWVSLIRFWQKWFDALAQQSILLNYRCTYLTSQTQISQSTQLLALGQDMIGELVTIVLDNIKKSISVMNLKNLITELSVSYLNSYAASVNSQLYQAILDESWQSVQIPQQFSDVLNGIMNRPTQNQNMSLTILNSSSSQMSTSFNNTIQGQKGTNTLTSNSTHFKYKILKNNILLEGQRYKLTYSFLLLCEFIEEWIRVGRLFQAITGQTDEQAIKQSKYVKFIISHLYSKIYELVDYFNNSTKEMILQKKALKMEKIKGNNIAVKHICLLSNCLTFIQKLTNQIPHKDLSLIVNRKQQQIQTLRALTNHNILLIDKISSILNKKMQQLVAAFKAKEQQKSFNLVNLHQFVVQSNQQIVALFLQITQIIDEYLDVEKCESILKLPFQIFVQKYFKTVILKGEKFVQQARLLLEKMKFLKKYFKNQFLAMFRQIQQ